MPQDDPFATYHHSDPFGSPDQPSTDDSGFEEELEVASPLLPPGEYVVRCTGARRMDSKEGNPMIAWNFYVEQHGVQVSTFTVLNNEVGTKIARDFMKVLSPTDLEQNERGNIKIKYDATKQMTTPVVRGRRAVAVIKHGTYMGEDQLQINRLKALPASESSVDSKDIPF